MANICNFYKQFPAEPNKTMSYNLYIWIQKVFIEHWSYKCSARPENMKISNLMFDGPYISLETFMKKNETRFFRYTIQLCAVHISV